MRLVITQIAVEVKARAACKAEDSCLLRAFSTNILFPHKAMMHHDSQIIDRLYR